MKELRNQLQLLSESCPNGEAAKLIFQSANAVLDAAGNIIAQSTELFQTLAQYG